MAPESPGGRHQGSRVQCGEGGRKLGNREAKPGRVDGLSDRPRFIYRSQVLLNSYGSPLNLARDPIGSTDRSQGSAIDRAVAPFGFGLEGRLVGVRAVAPVVVPEPKPESLGRIELGRVRRQEERRDPLGLSQPLRVMPARAVEDHDGVLPRPDPRADMVEEILHRSGVRVAQGHRRRPARRGLDRREDPDGLAAVLPNHARPRAGRGPHRAEGSLLPEPGRVLEEHPHPGPRPCVLHTLDKRGRGAGTSRSSRDPASDAAAAGSGRRSRCDARSRRRR
jgi:hypothetical protein